MEPILFISVEEIALDVAAVLRDLKAEGNCDFTFDDYGVPETADGGGRDGLGLARGLDGDSGSKKNQQRLLRSTRLRQGYVRAGPLDLLTAEARLT